MLNQIIITSKITLNQLTFSQFFIFVLDFPRYCLSLFPGPQVNCTLILDRNNQSYQRIRITKIPPLLAELSSRITSRSSNYLLGTTLLKLLRPRQIWTNLSHAIITIFCCCQQYGLYHHPNIRMIDMLPIVNYKV